MKRFTFVLTAAVVVSLLSSCATRSNRKVGAQVVTNRELEWINGWPRVRRN